MRHSFNINHALSEVNMFSSSTILGLLFRTLVDCVDNLLVSCSVVQANPPRVLVCMGGYSHPTDEFRRSSVCSTGHTVPTHGNMASMVLC